MIDLNKIEILYNAIVWNKYENNMYESGSEDSNLVISENIEDIVDDVIK